MFRFRKPVRAHGILTKGFCGQMNALSTGSVVKILNYSLLPKPIKPHTSLRNHERGGLLSHEEWQFLNSYFKQRTVVVLTKVQAKAILTTSVLIKLATTALRY